MDSSHSSSVRCAPTVKRSNTELEREHRPGEVSGSHGDEYEGGCCAVKCGRRRPTHRPHDGGSKHLGNIGQCLPDFQAQHPRMQPCSNTGLHAHVWPLRGLVWHMGWVVHEQVVRSKQATRSWELRTIRSPPAHSEITSHAVSNLTIRI
jgi:hypothetical protein